MSKTFYREKTKDLNMDFPFKKNKSEKENCIVKSKKIIKPIVEKHKNNQEINIKEILEIKEKLEILQESIFQFYYEELENTIKDDQISEEEKVDYSMEILNRLYTEE